MCTCGPIATTTVTLRLGRCVRECYGQPASRSHLAIVGRLVHVRTVPVLLVVEPELSQTVPVTVAD